MRNPLLDEPWAGILTAERALLTALAAALAPIDPGRSGVEEAQRALAALDDVFLLVVAGEFNSGKSSFVNALLGAKVLAEGVTPTTDRIHLLVRGPEEGLVRRPDVTLVTHPAAVLEGLAIVDTPGTNAVLQEHQELTERFVPRSDLVLFVTSADRPFTESERRFLELIRAWGKKVVLIVNKIDILEPAERDEVLRFVGEHAARVLAETPRVFAVSARAAARGEADSGIAEVERFVTATLDAGERIRLKLDSPLGVASKLVDEYSAPLAARLAVLEEDIATLARIERDLGLFRTGLRQELDAHVARIHEELYELERRGQRFFDETLRLTRLFDLANRERIRGAFEREVVAGTPAAVEARAQQLIDWMVERTRAMWSNVVEALHRRQAAAGDDLIGSVGRTFHYERAELLSSIGASVERTLASYDAEAEARALANAVQTALGQTALGVVGGIGISTIVAALVTTTAADVTGILAGITLATLGLFVIPAKRRRAQLELSAKMQALREKVGSAIRAGFEEELERAVTTIQQAIAPYTRFVNGESDELRRSQSTLGDLRKEVARLRTLLARPGA